MGEFHVWIDDSPRCIVPNILHREGSLLLWQAAFNDQPVVFKAGLTGVNIPWDRNQRPDWDGSIAPDFLRLDLNTTWADLQEAESLEGGGAYHHDSNTHRELMGYAEKTVTFSVEELSDAVKVSSAVMTWTNAVPWTNYSDPVTKSRGVWASEWYNNPNHGYPWSCPSHRRGEYHKEFSGWATLEYDDQRNSCKIPSSAGPEYVGFAVWVLGEKHTVVAADDSYLYTDIGFGLAGLTVYYSLREASKVVDEVEEYRYRGASLPVGAIWIASASEPRKLVASAVFGEPVRIPPQGTLNVEYHLRLRPYVPGVDDDDE